MPHEPLNVEPTAITAGTTVQWDRSIADHPPADGWTLKYAIRGPVDLDIAATPDGDVYQVRISAAQSGQLVGGSYQLYGYIEKGDDRFGVYSAPLQVRPSPLAAVGKASSAVRILAAIDARLEGRITEDMEEVTINGRSVKSIPIETLVKLRGIYASKVAAERNPGRLGFPVKVRFARAS